MVFPAFSSLEDVEQARSQLAARFELGEQELEKKCSALQTQAENMVARLTANLKSRTITLDKSVQTMKMGQFLREYDCSQLTLLLTGTTTSRGPSGGTSAGDGVRESKLGRYGTIKTPGKPKHHVDFVPQTPMDSGTGASARQAGTFTVIKGGDGTMSVVLPDGQSISTNDSVENKAEAVRKLKAVQDDIQAMLAALE